MSVSQYLASNGNLPYFEIHICTASGSYCVSQNCMKCCINMVFILDVIVAVEFDLVYPYYLRKYDYKVNFLQDSSSSAILLCQLEDKHLAM